jgi:GNAT superfamily N-acetyltransferase
MAPNQPFVVRPAQALDKEQWEKMFVDYGVFYETHFSPDVVAGVWEWVLNSNHPVSAFVADQEGELLGFAHLREQSDTFVAGPSWFLDDLFTTPKARGKGVATALIAAVSAHAKDHGGGDVRWITAEDNHTAQRLYDTLATRTTWVMYEKNTTERI